VIYFIRLGPDGPVKIGSTARLRARLKELAHEHGVEIRVLGIRDGSFKEEREHQRRFAHLRLDKRRRTGPYERFEPAADLLSYIERQCQQTGLVDVIEEAKPVTSPVRLDLPTRSHRLLRRVAADEDVSMATYARDLIMAHLEEKARTKGIKL